MRAPYGALILFRYLLLLLFVTVFFAGAFFKSIFALATGFPFTGLETT